ncbi:unnamed protein product [Trichogramma brassicae]|uniref:Uncharacterized protein n=1 Tax=Trichogramma brassicae TaxID=86971 RepID=A0A6H5IPT6_9HYME|nr:unnamed protein product [Trichogramma brassicae]
MVGLCSPLLGGPFGRIGSRAPYGRDPCSARRPRDQGSSSGSSAQPPREHGCGNSPSRFARGRASALWPPGHPVVRLQPPVFLHMPSAETSQGVALRNRNAQESVQCRGNLLLGGTLVQVFDLDRGRVKQSTGCSRSAKHLA